MVRCAPRQHTLQLLFYQYLFQKKDSLKSVEDAFWGKRIYTPKFLQSPQGMGKILGKNLTAEEVERSDAQSHEF